MGKLFLDISMSLDGFIAGPDQTLVCTMTVESPTGVWHLGYRVTR